jgi:hypothetical protein
MELSGQALQPNSQLLKLQLDAQSAEVLLRKRGKIKSH